MIRFECDYNEGAHPKILEKLLLTNEEQTAGYGLDAHCENARGMIQKLCACEQAAVHFLVGGTQANTTIIASLLRAHQGVIAAASGHISHHETGAIEATGHKVLTVPSADGKITAQQVRTMVEGHYADATREHNVQPGMVYLSQPTENGTLYNKAELTALYAVCKEFGLPLFVDGARLGYGLASPANDISIAELAALCDVFYIGGTKVGALFGEAVVITNPSLQTDFRYFIKQRGGMLAKGRLLGIQFETLFENGLYFEIAQHAVALALRLKDAFVEKGYTLLYDSHTNQQFPILPDAHLAALAEKYAFSEWTRVDDTHTAVRFCTSWATKSEAVDALIADIKAL